MSPTSGGSCVAASTRTFWSVIQCDGVVTTLMAEVRERRRAPRCGVVWCAVVWCGVVPKALLLEGNGRDVYPRVQVNGRAVCVVCELCVSVWFWGQRRGSRRNLVVIPLATVFILGAPDVLPLSRLAGAGVAHAIPTPSCCPGSGGLLATWHAPWWGLQASARCSSTASSHNRWRTRAPCVPTFWSSHAASRRRDGSHSWGWARQA